MSRIILCLLIMFQSIAGYTQSDETEEQPNVVQKYGPRRQISTIVYMGLAGAVLGLSTLSFYGRPQDKLTNIPIGFGIGVVVGTIYMTYQAATNPDEFYREARYDYKPDFAVPPTQPDLLVSDLLLKKENPTFGYTWQF